MAGVMSMAWTPICLVSPSRSMRACAASRVANGPATAALYTRRRAIELSFR
jgi:hypothetical protein